MTEIQDREGAVLAVAYAGGIFTCSACGCPLQRTTTGDIRDGVRVHYRTVHPERNIR